MYLKCNKCKEPDDRILIAKYYPTGGWYFWTGGSITFRKPEEIQNTEIAIGLMRAGEQPADDRLRQFDEWFEKHRHAEDDDYNFSIGDTCFVIEYESI